MNEWMNEYVNEWQLSQTTQWVDQWIDWIMIQMKLWLNEWMMKKGINAWVHAWTEYFEDVVGDNIFIDWRFVSLCRRTSSQVKMIWSTTSTFGSANIQLKMNMEQQLTKQWNSTHSSTTNPFNTEKSKGKVLGLVSDHSVMKPIGLRINWTRHVLQWKTNSIQRSTKVWMN